MTSELEDIILTVDSREKNQQRIKAVEDYFTGHGAVVEHSALQHCDYRLIGEFRGVPVNLGVEAKGWDNFLSDSIDDMEEKLLLATEAYDHVGFFVESQNYTFTPDESNKHGKLNYSIPRLNKDLPAKTLATFQGFLDTISKHPQIHVRQLRGEAEFPYSLYALLVYLQKPHILTIKPEGYVPSLQNLYMQIPQVGIERAKKLIEHYPNLFWLCSASEESLISVMGNSQGTIIYQYLHNTELQTPEWMAGHHRDGTVKYKTICGQDCYNPQHCNELCERHPNNPKFKKGSIPSTNISQSSSTEQNQKQPEMTRSHVRDIIATNIRTTKLSAHDTSSHPGTFLKSVTSHPQPDDPQGLPPKNELVVKQESLRKLSSPAKSHEDIEYKGDFKEVKPNVIDLKPKMNLKETIKDFMQDGKPHLMQEIVYHCEGWTPGNVYEHVMGAVKSGYFKKITEQNGRRITFQRIT